MHSIAERERPHSEAVRSERRRFVRVLQTVVDASICRSSVLDLRNGPFSERATTPLFRPSQCRTAAKPLFAHRESQSWSATGRVGIHTRPQSAERLRTTRLPLPTRIAPRRQGIGAGAEL